MSPDLAAVIVFGTSCAVSGWFIWQSSRSRLSGLALLVGGVLFLFGCAAALLQLDSFAPMALRLAACVAVPLAILAYPHYAWRDPLSFVVLVVVAAAGALCVLWPESLEPMTYVIVCGLLVQAWWNFERGDADARRALTWSSLAWIGAGLVDLSIGFTASSASAPDSLDLFWAYIVIPVLGPAAMAIGVVRPELVDVRGLVTKAVVAATALVTYIAVAAGLLAAIDIVRGHPLEASPTLVLCAVLAFGVHPLQVMLRGVVDQILFGIRPDPLAAATSLADRIGDDPALALDAIREALVLPFACLRVGDELLASSGSEVTHTRTLPLQLGGDSVGEVVVGLRAGDLGLSTTDEDVLRIVAPLLAQTLRARAMSRDLQQSREAVVNAVEEERRRLRRDLHDGLGPTLSGVAFATDAARNQLRTDPEKADELLVLLRADTAGAITEIRRLVDGLRPPALDQLGLVGAIRQHASSLHSATGSPLLVTVTVPVELPPLSAAIEVAAYRIVIEALTNVVRHAHASCAMVDLSVHEQVMTLSVRDDGNSQSAWSPGVGITSMQERSQQLGGTLRATRVDKGGLVTATIPLNPPGV